MTSKEILVFKYINSFTLFLKQVKSLKGIVKLNATFEINYNILT